jgi:putative endonuclease
MSKQPMKDRGEAAAAAYLERIGIAVVERRWSCEVGKIDVIAWDGDTLVIVDVVTRKASRQSEQWAATPAKARRVKRLVKAYVQHADLKESTPWRYDRIDLLVISDDRALLRHHRDALSTTE